MSSFPSNSEVTRVTAVAVQVSAEELCVSLSDGRTITVPLSWFPRLATATPERRAHWQLVGAGEGIHWPDLDEDLSVESLLRGRR